MTARTTPRPGSPSRSAWTSSAAATPSSPTTTRARPELEVEDGPAADEPGAAGRPGRRPGLRRPGLRRRDRLGPPGGGGPRPGRAGRAGPGPVEVAGRAPRTGPAGRPRPLGVGGVRGPAA